MGVCSGDPILSAAGGRETWFFPHLLPYAEPPSVSASAIEFASSFPHALFGRQPWDAGVSV